MDTIKFKCDLSTSDASCPLGIEIRLDGQRIYCNEWLKENTTVEYDIPEEDGDHELQWILTGKTDEHTQVDTDGHILKDAVLTVSNIHFDDILIDQVVSEQAVYTHNHNGHSDIVEDKFYGIMGCNGSVSLKVTFPFYIWLLENM